MSLDYHVTVFIGIEVEETTFFTVETTTTSKKWPCGHRLDAAIYEAAHFCPTCGKRCQGTTRTTRTLKPSWQALVATRGVDVESVEELSTYLIQTPHGPLNVVNVHDDRDSDICFIGCVLGDCNVTRGGVPEAWVLGWTIEGLGAAFESAELRLAHVHLADYTPRLYTRRIIS